VSRGLAEVSTSSLERIRDALRSGQLRAPLTRSDLVAFGVRAQLDALVAVLEGHAQAAVLSVLDAVLAERTANSRPAPELVWTGPEGGHAAARDTAVVLRELFERARQCVILGGYTFLNADAVLAPLHRVMRDHGVVAHFFVQIEQLERAVADPEAYGRAALHGFLQASWPFGAPHPNLYCDRRALVPGPPWCSLHAKCVAVDGERAFVSSANFTTRAQDRNIEAGVLLHDAAFAAQLQRQWMSLIEDGLVLELASTMR
jgi:hypothetical protein